MHSREVVDWPSALPCRGRDVAPTCSHRRRRCTPTGPGLSFCPGRASARGGRGRSARRDPFRSPLCCFAMIAIRPYAGHPPTTRLAQWAAQLEAIAVRVVEPDELVVRAPADLTYLDALFDQRPSGGLEVI